MRVCCIALVAAAALVAVGVARAHAADEEASAVRGPFEKIHVIEFNGDIEAMMSTYVRRRVEAAREAGADCIVLRIESPGGTVFHSEEIGDLLLELPDTVHTVAWVPKMALSGAAFVSLACREIVMAPGASLGDAQPILGGADGKPIPVGEKAESPLRAIFTKYARKNGYPVLLAQAMVSERMEIIRVRPRAGGASRFVQGDEFRQAADDAELFPGLAKRDLVQVGSPIVAKDELLTMTAEEALELGFIARRYQDGLFPTEQRLLDALKAPGATVTLTEMTFSEKASKWLLAVAGMLAAVVMISIALFMFQGPGLMTIIGGVALGLVILINVSVGQVNGFPIFLVLLGVALLAVEVFLIPGFGLPGIAGIVSMATGFLYLVTGSSWNQTSGITSDAFMTFALQFTFTTIAALLVMLTMSRFLPKIGPAKRMVLQPSGAPAVATTTDSTPPPPAGSIGRALSPLRPAGSADFDGTLTDVVSDGGFIPAQSAVEVVAVEGDRVTVRAVDHGSSGGSEASA